MNCRGLIGGLIYLSQKMRPDIAYSVGMLTRQISYAKQSDWNAAQRVQVLEGTADFGLFYSSSENPELVCFADTDFAGSEDHKSTNGMAINFGD